MDHKLYMLGAATLALSLAIPVGAVAQDAAGDDAITLDKVTITGARLQNQQAIEQKRNADTISDFITADDVGALPDFSLAEAITRIPGISVEGRNGDAEFIVVRGLRSDFNYLSLDGGIIASTRSNGRATQTSIVPSYVIKSTEVAKSFTADMDGNAIGGQVMVNTRSAFDQDETYFAARGALGYFDHNEGPDDLEQSSRADFAWTQQFGQDDQFGIVLSASYSLQDYNTWLPGVAFSEYDFFDPDGTRNTVRENAAPGFVEVPHGAQMYQYQNKIERLGGLAKLEWRPSDQFYAALTAYHFEEDDTEQRWDTLIFRNRRGNIPDNLTDTAGRVNEGRAYNQYFLQGDTNTVSSVSLSGSWTPSDKHEVDFIIVAADGERENPFYQVRFDNTTANETLFAFDYDNSGEYPVINFVNPEVWTDATLYSPIFYRPRLDINEQEAFQAKVDYGFNMDGEGWGFKTGLSFRSDERFQDQLQDNDFRPDSDATRGWTLDNALLGLTNTFDPNLVPGQPQFFIDEDAFLQFFNATSDEWRDAKTPEVEAISSQFTVTEDITAAYLMGQYKGPNFLFNAGLRYEDTSLDTTGGVRINGDYVLDSASAGYDNWLPSASLIWDPTDQFRIRAAYSRSLGRAEYNDLARTGSRTVDDAELTISQSGGNPGLDPRISDNYDLSLEYYFDTIDGAVSLGVFRKEIDNEIFTRTIQEEVQLNGQTYTFTDRRPENANTATLNGLEVGITVGSLDFIAAPLSDVGFTVNYTLLDGEFSIEESEGGEQRELYGLIRQPRNIFNASAFWAPGDFEFRAAYRYVDENLITPSASSPTFDEFIGPEERLDLQGRWAVPQEFVPGGITLFAEARNLTDDGIDRDLSYDRTKWTRDYGRSAWVGLIYKY